MLNTKVKVEEPHKRKDILECLNCQDYGHTKKYCSYTSRCVRYGENHPSTSCSKPNTLPAKCALCKGDHPSNYKGCQVYKDLQNFRKPTKKNHGNYLNNNNSFKNIDSHTNNVNNNYCKVTQEQPPKTNPFPSSYAQAASNQNPNSTNPTNENSLTNFINEFKAIINPLLSLLTSVLNRLPAQNDK